MKSRLPTEVSPSGRFTRHVLSSAFSVLEKPEMEALAESIRHSGQLEEIVLFEGCVLDGWNRVLVSERLGIEPRVRHLDPSELAVDQVVARNFGRRHVTHSRKAVSMADVFYEVNQLDVMDRTPTRVPGGSAAPLISRPSIWTTVKVWPKTRAELATLAGVSETLMKQALRLRANAAPSVVAAVRSGEVPLEEALKLLWQPIHHQTGCLAELIQERADAKITRRENQKQAAKLKKSGQLRGSGAVPTAEGLQASGHLVQEDFQAESNVPTNVTDTPKSEREVWAGFTGATRMLERCASALALNANGETAAGGIDGLAKACMKFLALVANRG